MRKVVNVKDNTKGDKKVLILINKREDVQNHKTLEDQ